MHPVLHGNKKWISSSEAVRLYGKDRHTFRTWAEKGYVEVKASHKKRAWLYKIEDIEKLMGLR